MGQTQEDRPACIVVSSSGGEGLSRLIQKLRAGGSTGCVRPQLNYPAVAIVQIIWIRWRGEPGIIPGRLGYELIRAPQQLIRVGLSGVYDGCADREAGGL